LRRNRSCSVFPSRDPCTQPRHAAADALSHNRLGDPRRTGDAGVVAFVQEPRPQRFALFAGELFEKLDEADLGSEPLQLRDVLGVELDAPRSGS
jgi:hypothetical protein